MSVSKITANVIPLKLGVVIGPTDRKNYSTFGGGPILDTDSGSFPGTLFHTLYQYGIADLGDSLSFLIPSLVIWSVSTTPSKMTDTYSFRKALKTHLFRNALGHLAH